MIRKWPFLLCLTSVEFAVASGPSEVLIGRLGTAHREPETSEAKDDVALRLASYELIWQTVNQNHFDPTFGGLDWSAIHDKYLDLVKHVEDDAGFLAVTNEMLGELGLSHYAVFKSEHDSRPGSATNGILGLETRLLDGEVVITSIKKGYPAAAAGLKPGYVLKEIDSVPVEKIIRDGEKKALPNATEAGRRANASRAVYHRLIGNPGTSVSLSYLDGDDVPHQSAMLRMERRQKMTRAGSLPPIAVAFESRRITDKIGYIRFSPFVEPVGERCEQAIDDMMNVRGLILDIRGNPGGYHVVGEAIASKLVQKETLFSIFRYRDRTEKVVVRPSEKTYDGPVVVLIDELSASASERFAGCLQSIGRASVIGERSNGAVGPARVIRLPNGTSFYYLIAQSLTPDGVVLEGRGVIPDKVVRLNRETLLAGRDLQLEQAVAFLNT